MKIIASFPCLGKTTIVNLNKDKCMERKFDISKSMAGMNQIEKDDFLTYCVKMIGLQFRVGSYPVMFIDDDDRLIRRLGEDPEMKKNMLLVYPNAMNWSDIEEYMLRVSDFYGTPWMNKNLMPKIDVLADRIKYFRGRGFDVRLTGIGQKYIRDVVNLPKDFITPGDDDADWMG